MFEKIIEFHQNEILQIFAKYKLQYFDEINDCQEIPQWLKNYFNAKINSEIYNLKLYCFANNWFDLSTPEIAATWSAFELAMNSKAKFDFRTINSWVLEATQNHINFLIRPCWTLLNFIFKENIELPISIIRQRLLYFDNYQYLLGGIGIYLDENELNPNNLISKEQMNLLINEIEREFFKTKTADEIVDILDPLFEFFNIYNYEDEFLPISALKIFIEDNNWKSLENALIETQKRTNAILWTKAQVKEFLGNYSNIDFENARSNQIPLFNNIGIGNLVGTEDQSNNNLKEKIEEIPEEINKDIE
ncbi:hypothetical protein LLG34_09320 [bacterium]|nr:hypothetical protein [bacterium]